MMITTEAKYVWLTAGSSAMLNVSSESDVSAKHN